MKLPVRVMLYVSSLLLPLLMTKSWATEPHTKISIGSTNHPKASLYWPLIAKVYANLGFEVEIIESPAARGLALVSMGTIQADVARLGVNVDSDPNLIKISPPLTQGKVMLLCVKNVPCSLPYLINHREVAFASKGVKRMIETSLPELKIATMEAEGTLIELLRRDRVQYVIHVDVQEARKSYDKEFKVIELRTVDIHHVIHKSLALWKDKISIEIQNQLPWFEKNFSHKLEAI